jgi:hypothetical protein
VKFPADSFIARSSLADFDLSWNKSLRNLEVSVNSLDFASRDGSLDSGSRLLKYALSTIKSPTFSWIELLFPDPGYGYRSRTTLFIWSSYGPPDVDVSRYRWRFKLLRELRKVRDFELVLHAIVSGQRAGHLVQTLKDAVAAEKSAGGFDDLFPEPLVTFTLRSFLQPARELFDYK